MVMVGLRRWDVMMVMVRWMVVGRGEGSTVIQALLSAPSAGVRRRWPIER